MNTIGSSGYNSSAMLSGMQRTPPSASSLAQELISTADSDSDGGISKSEFAELIQNADSDNIDALYEEGDSDGDGLLSETELTSLLEQMREAMPQGPMDAGQIPPPPPPPDAGQLITEGDTDSDGALSEEEFTAALQLDGESDTSILSQMFAETDTDGDGLVTEDELEIAMTSHRPPPPPPPPEGEAMGDAGETEQSDMLSSLVEAMLNQYSSNDDTSSTLSLTA